MEIGFFLDGHLLNKTLLSCTNSILLALDIRAPLPPGVSMLPTQKQRVPPPPGEDNREVGAHVFLSFICSNLESLYVLVWSERMVRYQILFYAYLSAFMLVMAERGSKRQWAQDPPSSGEDPPAEGDKTGAARPCRSVQLQKEKRSVVCWERCEDVVFTI